MYFYMLTTLWLQLYYEHTELNVVLTVSSNLHENKYIYFPKCLAKFPKKVLRLEQHQSVISSGNISAQTNQQSCQIRLIPGVTRGLMDGT